MVRRNQAETRQWSASALEPGCQRPTGRRRVEGKEPPSMTSGSQSSSGRCKAAWRRPTAHRTRAPKQYVTRRTVKRRSELFRLDRCIAEAGHSAARWPRPDNANPNLDCVAPNFPSSSRPKAVRFLVPETSRSRSFFSCFGSNGFKVIVAEPEMSLLRESAKCRDQAWPNRAQLCPKFCCRNHNRNTARKSKSPVRGVFARPTSIVSHRSDSVIWRHCSRS